MTPRPYQIIVAPSLRDLAIQVNDMVAAGWLPQGGPFHAGIYEQPHGGIAQAIFRTYDPPPVVDPKLARLAEEMKPKLAGSDARVKK